MDTGLHGVLVAMLASTKAPRTDGATARLEELFADYFDFVWRSLRRFGLNDAAADDAAQQVFIVASRRLDDIRKGSERSFLFGVARRTASDVRRSSAVRHEVPDEHVATTLDGSADAEELIDQKRARELLDATLDALPDDLREVLVLFELEGMTSAEIARLLDKPQGTIQSRLRRARQLFEAALARHMAVTSRRLA